MYRTTSVIYHVFMSDTPILDGLGAERVPAPAGDSSSRVAVLVGVAGGLAFFALHSAPGAFARLPRARSLWALAAAAVLAYAATVVIHELGHCVAGTLAGFRLLSVSFGPLGFSRLGRRWRVDLVRGALGRGGGAAMVPRATSHLRARMLLMVAGGSAATLLAAALAAGFLARDRGSVFLWLFLGIAAITAVLSLIPHRRGELVNDGAHLWKLCRSGAAGSRMCALFSLSAMDAAGVRPDKWDSEWIRLAVGGLEGPDAALGECFGYYHRIAADDPLPAARHLERALSLSDTLGPARRAVLYLEAAFVHGWWRRDGPRARAWFEDARRLRALPVEALSGAEAAVLLGEGRLPEAQVKAADALAYLDRRGLQTGLAHAERRWLRLLLEKGDRRI